MSTYKVTICVIRYKYQSPNDCCQESFKISELCAREVLLVLSISIYRFWLISKFYFFFKVELQIDI